MADLKTPQPTGIITRVRTDYLTGAAAGDVTLAGIKAGGEDRILRVLNLTLLLTDGTPNVTLSWTSADVTSEFSITADDTINNTGVTTSDTDLLIVVWYDGDYGETVAV